MMNFVEAEAPTCIKFGAFGKPGSGKTYTAAKVLSQFIAKFLPESQLAIFDTENGSGHVKNMVKEISGKPLIAPAVEGTIGELMDFYEECDKRGFVALIDSMTAPRDRLYNDRMVWRQDRVRGARGDWENTKLTIADYQYINAIWGKFNFRFVHWPVHTVLLGREGIEWGIIVDDEGKTTQGQTGVKMKANNEIGHEPNVLMQMRARQEDPTGRTSVRIVHEAVVWKDRSDSENMTGKIGVDPDIEFFMPHIRGLNLGGTRTQPDAPAPTFQDTHGESLESIEAKRAAVLENIKDDLVEVMPGQTADEKKKKVAVLRQAFGGTSSWTELEKDYRKWPVERLNEGREKLQIILKELNKEVSDANG